MLNDLLSRESELTEVVPAEKSNGRKWLRRTSITAGVTAVTLVSGAGLYLASVNSNIERADLMNTSVGAAPASAKDALNIMILGSAESAKGTEESKGDVVMVLHISGDRKEASLVSFPRPMYVDVPGEGMSTLASTYETGGTKLTVSTLEDVTKTRIDHVMVADYDGFTALAQQVGAVEVNNPVAFSSSGSTFAKGRITLTTEQMQAFVKANSDDKEGAQQLRQRLVLEAGMQKGLSKSTLSNPAKLNKFVKTATSNVVVDKSFTAAAIAKIAASLDLTADNITLVRAPLSDEVKTVDGAEVREVDESQFKDLAAGLANDELGEYISEHGSK